MDETAWLVEMPDLPPRWVGFIDGKNEWTTNPNRALRFARKEDADNFKSWWCRTAISVEHRWL